MRFSALIMCCYFLVILSCYLISPKQTLLFAFPGFIMICAAFYCTYRDRTRLASGIMNTVMILWLLHLVYRFGWDGGVQHFIFAMLVLYFITSLAKLRLKVVYSVLLCALRMGLFWYTQFHEPAESVPDNLHVAFQAVNTLTVCLLIVTVLLIYTKDSRQMEEKLIIYNEELKKLASRDPLTGLRNRRSVLEYLEEKTEYYKKGKFNAVSVAIADIDYFKKVNDVYGHECGDIVLKRIASVFEDYMKDIGIVGRWGGEEFLFVFNNRNGDDAYTDLLNIQLAVKKMVIPYNGEELRVTLTYGLTEYDSNKEIDIIIKEADEKLYMGKNSGRNRIVY